MRMPPYHTHYRTEFFACRIAPPYIQAKIGTVKRSDKDLRIAQAQTFYNVCLCYLVGCSG